MEIEIKRKEEEIAQIRDASNLIKTIEGENNEIIESRVRKENGDEFDLIIKNEVDWIIHMK